MAAIFSKPKTPKIPPPQKMPDPVDPALMEERRRKQADMMRRGGRESTILSDALSGSTGKLGA